MIGLILYAYSRHLISTYKDFMKLLVKQLPDYFSVRGMRTSCKIVDFIAQSFTATELMFKIIESIKIQLKINSVQLCIMIER